MLSKRSIDVLRTRLPLRKSQVELGYHRAETGPTSNFVGNHMTQGAIDLVQAELKQKTTAVLPLSNEPAGNPKFAPPDKSMAPHLAPSCKDIKSDRNFSSFSKREGSEGLHEQGSLIVHDTQKPTLAQLKSVIRRRRAE